MADLRKLLTKVGALQHALKEHELQEKRLRGFMDKTAEAVRRAVRSGETTGDRIKDFVLACVGVPREEDEKRYRAIDEALKGRRKEFVLVTRPVEIDRGPKYHHAQPPDQARMGIMAPPPSTETVTRFKCGILQAEELVFSFDEHPRCKLPVTKWAVESDYCEGDLRKKSSSEDISEMMFGSAAGHLVLESMTDSVPDELFPFVSKVVVGDKAVRSWLKENRHDAEAIYKNCANLLGKLVLTPE